MNKKFLIDRGYNQINNNTYKKVDKKTGMTVELVFSDKSNNVEIEDNIINILTKCS